MNPFQVVPSTTSHKHEAIGPTLDVFARLGFRDIDLNLNHLIERGVSVDQVQRALAKNGQRVALVSGGWCDFFDRPPKIEQTFGSVARQVEMARSFGVSILRLFFGRLDYERYSPAALATIVGNLRRLADEYREMLFVLENHDGASAQPSICREVITGVERSNVRINFDPINFEHRGVDSLAAAAELGPLIAHVHLKGYQRGRFCEFGLGEVDLVPVLRTLIAGGYRGAFTVEYEGPSDRTVRLFTSMRGAESTIHRVRALA